MKLLKGIAWDHPRGFDPMVATANLFQKKNPEVPRFHADQKSDFPKIPRTHMDPQKSDVMDNWSILLQEYV